MQNYITTMSKKFSLLLHTPVKAVLPRTVTTARTEKVPQQAQYYQQLHSPWNTACSPHQPKQVLAAKSALCWYGRYARGSCWPGPLPAQIPMPHRLSLSACTADTVQICRADSPGFLPHTNPLHEVLLIGNVLHSGVT